MSFNQIVWKMAKVHYKKYILYFLCNSFAVMFFFMFSTVYFNEQVVRVKKLESIQYVLTVPGVALVVFTVFFISYAHNIFIKRRRSEIGLFMTLGMSNRDISKLLLLENVIIAIFSIISGILSGIIFSRLFFLLLMNSVGLQEVPFQLNSKMFVYSIITFLIVFFIAVGQSLFLILKRSVIHSLKSDKIAETIKMKNPLLGGVGLAIIIGSILGLYYTYSDPNAGEFLLFWAITTLIGLYISLYQFTSLFIELAKKYKPFYYRRLLFLASLDYKFKQLTSILMLVTVMIMITILYSTIILSTYMLIEKKVIDRNPFDIAFIQTENKNNLALEDLYSIVDQKENPVQKHLVIPIYTYYQKQPYSDWSYVYHFMAVDHFNQLTSNQLKLQDNEFVYYINDDPESEGSGNDYNQGVIFPIRNENVTYTRKETIIEKNINNLSNLHDFIIVSNSEFESLKDKLDGFESNLHLINVANWKKTTNTVERLEKSFKSYNVNTPPIVDVRVENASEEDLFQVASKVEDYNHNNNSNGILFFVTCFLSVIFFFGSFTLLYLYLFSEIDKEKDKYKKLKYIGITTKEVKRIISREITTLFFVPTLVGTTLAFLYIVAMAKDIGGITKNPEILLHFLIVAVIYHSIQVGFFLYGRKKMFYYLTGH
jgi:ABC-type lipoprotein release transport system permease subunit